MSKLSRGLFISMHHRAQGGLYHFFEAEVGILTLNWELLCDLTRAQSVSPWKELYRSQAGEPCVDPASDPFIEVTWFRKNTPGDSLNKLLSKDVLSVFVVCMNKAQISGSITFFSKSFHSFACSLSSHFISCTLFPMIRAPAQCD